LDVATISVPRLALSFIPVAIVVVLMWRWHLGLGRSFHAIARMLLQLTLIGYVLIYIFQAESGLIICGVLAVMLVAASWVALNTVDLRKTTLFPASLVSVLLGGGTTLLLITHFAASMTNISLAVERLHAELENGRTFERARDIAFRASMIPVINSFFAVGLISLPGMMTGQILSGVSPLVAVRYQIMVMCMIFGAAGLSTVCFLTLIRKRM